MRRTRTGLSQLWRVERIWWLHARSVHSRCFCLLNLYHHLLIYHEPASGQQLS